MSSNETSSCPVATSAEKSELCDFPKFLNESFTHALTHFTFRFSFISPKIYQMACSNWWGIFVWSDSNPLLRARNGQFALKHCCEDGSAVDRRRHLARNTRVAGDTSSSLQISFLLSGRLTSVKHRSLPVDEVQISATRWPSDSGSHR